ncbi:MAG TPA: GAF domain-containing protein [Candidatus Cybelea sp.]|nr:GAF domain-containing protein [Candidatus Cybelea sp.]
MSAPDISLDAIRTCLEGVIPSWVATCSRDGTPNVTLLSQVHYVDPRHVALSYQFFNKTRENVLATARATVQVVDPVTGAVYRLSLQYLRTESEGPLFESMKAKLAGIASHTGMEAVFRLLGSDIYRVLDIERAPSGRLAAPAAPRSLLNAIRHCCAGLGAGAELDGMLDRLLSDLQMHLGIEHSMVLMADETRGCLFTVASRGYDASGVGSEIPIGQGVIGVAARERTPIRIAHMATEYGYSRAVRARINQLGLSGILETEIPWPGLTEPHSQIAVPILAGQRLIGVLFAESPKDMQFGYDDEDALATITSQIGTAVLALQSAAAAADESRAPPPARTQPQGPPVAIRRYAADDSVFIEQDYLIKGVAGAIFWKLVSEYAREQRTEFTNRELRLDPALRLPDVSENLEARLVLLERRLVERCPFVRIEKSGRGRFRLAVKRPLKLVNVGDASD